MKDVLFVLLMNFFLLRNLLIYQLKMYVDLRQIGKRCLPLSVDKRFLDEERNFVGVMQEAAKLARKTRYEEDTFPFNTLPFN